MDGIGWSRGRWDTLHLYTLYRGEGETLLVLLSSLTFDLFDFVVLVREDSVMERIKSILIGALGGGWLVCLCYCYCADPVPFLLLQLRGIYRVPMSWFSHSALLYLDAAHPYHIIHSLRLGGPGRRETRRAF